MSFERRIEIDPDIRQARTLPSWCYRDAGLHQDVVDRVFAGSWQFAGGAEVLPAVGGVRPWQLLEGCLDEPLLFTRDAEGSLHCLSNVCTHRGRKLIDQPAACSRLRCGYHGRTFGLDGCMLGAPGFTGADLDAVRADRLPGVPHACWRGLSFVTLRGSVPLGEHLRDLDRLVGWLPWEQAIVDPGRSRSYEVAANWMLYCDNFLEGLHIGFVHPKLSRSVDMAGYRTDCFATTNVQIGTAGADDPAFDLPEGHPEQGLRIGAFYFWCFPNLMLNVYPWGCSVNVVVPLGVDRTRIDYSAYVWAPELLDRGASADLDLVEREDDEVIEQVQVGIRSRSYQRGRYVPDHEAGVHHFHRLLAAALR